MEPLLSFIGLALLPVLWLWIIVLINGRMR